MASSRDEFTPSTKHKLADRAGHVCSMPGCGARTTGAKKGDAEGVVRLGQAAHITAAAQGGPRYDGNLSSEQRRHISNGIWLCLTHAAAVDADDRQFTVETLKAWKRDAEEQSWAALMRGPTGQGPPAARSENLQAIRARVVAASQDDIHSFTSGPRWPVHPIKLHLRLLSGERQSSFDAEGLARAISTFSPLVLVAAPGTGKTTSMIQVAEAAVASGLPAVFVPLTGWMLSGRSLFDYVRDRRAMAGCSEADLVELSYSGELLIALDGWNELDALSRRRADAAIRDFQRDYPDASIIVSTRRQAMDVPLGGTFIEIDSLTDEQQLAIAKAARGEAGATLLDQAWRTPGVADLVAIPLYLNALLSRNQGAELPRTKEQVLRNLVGEHEQASGNAEALRDQLMGTHDVLLAALAVEATQSGNTELSEARARLVINETEQGLVVAGQLASPAEPMLVIDTLVDHHALIRTDATARNVAFQHQQIQEWYASHELDRLMELVAGGDPAALQRLRVEILDDREWQESIFFAVERLSRRDSDGAAACGNAILVAMEIDPMLAAEMIFRSDEAAWARVALAMIDYCERWHTPGEVDRAVGFMIRTGRPEFAAEVRKLAGNPDSQVRFAAFRCTPRFRASVLGTDAKAWIASLDEEARDDVVGELALRSDLEGMKLAATIAKEDQSAKVKTQAAEMLAFRMSENLVTEVLLSAPDETYESLAEKGLPGFPLAGEVEAKLAAARQRAEAAVTNPISRLRQAFTRRPVSEEASRSVRQLIASPNFPSRDQHAAHALDNAYEIYPDAVRDGLIERLTTGLEIPHRAVHVFRDAADEFDDGPIPEIVLNPASPDHIARPASALAGPTTVGKLIDEFLGVSERLNDPLPREERDAHYAVYRRLSALIANARLDAFVRAVLARSAEEAPASIARLCEAFGGHGDNEEGRARKLDGSFEGQFSDRLIEWGQVVLSKGTRHQAAAVANAIARLAAPQLAQLLEKLLAFDLEGMSKDRGQRRGLTVNSNQFSRAFIAIGTPEVSRIMIAYLPNRDFGSSAAYVLAEIWKRKRGIASPTVLARWPDFSKVADERRQWEDARATAVDSMFAAAMFKVAADLIREGLDATSTPLALSLAKFGFTLPHAEHAAERDVLLQLPNWRRDKLGLLWSLIASGQVVPAEVALDGINAFIEASKTQPWLWKDGLFELEEWLSILPFSDRPDALFDALKLLPENARQPSDLDHVMSALAYAPAAEAILFSLPEFDPAFQGDYNWFRAIEVRATPGAVNLLVDLVELGKVDLRRGAGLWPIVQAVAAAMRSHLQVRATVYERYHTLVTPAGKALVASAIANAPDLDGLLLLISGYAQDGRGIDYELSQAIRNLVTTKEEVAEWSGAHSIVPVPAAEFRKALFDLAADTTSPIGALAAACLTVVDECRDELGPLT
jgi:hypothetical protein